MSQAFYNICNWVVNTIGQCCIDGNCCCCEACKNEKNLREFLAKYYDNCQYYEWKVRMSLQIVPKLFVAVLSYASVMISIICINWDNVSTSFDESKQHYIFCCIGAGVLLASEIIYGILLTFYYAKCYEFNIWKPFQGLFDVHIHWLAIYWIVIGTFCFSIVSYEF